PWSKPTGSLLLRKIRSSCASSLLALAVLLPRQVSTSATGSTLAKLRLPVIDPFPCECQPCQLSLFFGCKAALNIKPPKLFTTTIGPVYKNLSGPTLAV